MTQIKITSQQLTLRPIEVGDVSMTIDYMYHSPDDFIAGLGVDTSKLPNEKLYADRWLSSIARDGASHALVICVDHQPVGMHLINQVRAGEDAVFHAHIWRPDFRRRGIARYTYPMAAQIFLERFGLRRMLFKTPVQNTGALTVKRSLGIREIGDEIIDFGIIRAGTRARVFELTRDEAKVLLAKTGGSLIASDSGVWRLAIDAKV